MEELGWDRQRFIREFGKDYLAIFRDYRENNQTNNQDTDTDTDKENKTC